MTVVRSYLDIENNLYNPLQRAALSHAVRRHHETERKPSYIDSNWLDNFMRDARLPTPAKQATNAIQYIGDYVQRTGNKLDSLPVGFHVIIGAPNSRFATELSQELRDKGLCTAASEQNTGRLVGRSLNLTLSGWEKYENERKGKDSARYGFIAMKFDDAALDPLMRDRVKPHIRSELGYDLVDMRDIAQSGLIDNLMRQQIRDSAFVLVDLTHDNPGAYWEAGYAEGLGKPVLYLCEQEKFKAKGTHFDTNHLTTVIWSLESVEEFLNQLVATIRRSLNMFAR